MSFCYAPFSDLVSSIHTCFLFQTKTTQKPYRLAPPPHSPREVMLITFDDFNCISVCGFFTWASQRETKLKIALRFFFVVFVFLIQSNLVPRVFRLFGQRGNAGKTLGSSKKFNFFDWLFRNGFHCFTAEILR